MNRRFIVGDDLTLAEEFGLLFSLTLLALVKVSPEEGEAHGGGNTKTDQSDGDTHSQHFASPFNETHLGLDLISRAKAQ